MNEIVPRRTVVRGRTEDPLARLRTHESGPPTQPTRFSSGMWAVVMFIGSEVMFFAALFTTYFYLRTRVPEWELVFGHKPHWLGTSDVFGLIIPLVLINTIELVSSSVTMQLGVLAIRKGDRVALRNWLIVTLALGIAFLAGQGYEYTKLGFLPADGIFAGTFFTLTGFHGAHVTGGVLFIGLCLYRALRGQFSAARHLAIEAASIYWHFVDVVWIGLYTTIYIVG